LARPPRLPSVLDAEEGDILVDDLRWASVEVRSDHSYEEAVGVEIAQSRIAGALFTGSVLDHLRVRDAVVESCDFSGARLLDAALTRVEFRNCKMSGIDLAGAHLIDVVLVGCKLDGANLRMVTGDRVQFDDVHLVAGDFYGAKVAHIRFFDCDLTAVEFSRSELGAVRLHGSKLDGIKGSIALRSAVIDSTQVLAFALGIFAGLGITIDDARDAVDPRSS
jgi:uncharacterized protein YjbI with pentapeptide repeats